MEFLNIDHTTLEIYPKGENPSNIDDINENSHWISIAKIILQENPQLLSEDLNFFIDEVKKIFTSHVDTIKKELEKNYDNNYDNNVINHIFEELNNCFIDNDIITKIYNFIHKYNLSEFHSKSFAIIFNIITITDFITNQIENPNSMNVCTLVI